MANVLSEELLPIEIAVSFGVSPPLYVDDYYPNGRKHFSLRATMDIFFLALTEAAKDAHNGSALLSIGL